MKREYIDLLSCCIIALSPHHHPLMTSPTDNPPSLPLLGVSKILANTWQLAATAVGTPYYLSPEICQNKKYNQKSDIWSLGCVLYELATMKHAFEAPSMRALIAKIIKGQYAPLPSTRSKELRDLVDRMLTIDCNKRPSINDLLSTPVMKARIQRFLSSTLQHQEFSHTIIHGRPQPGQIVVGACPPVGGGGGEGGGLVQVPLLHPPLSSSYHQDPGSSEPHPELG